MFSLQATIIVLFQHTAARRRLVCGVIKRLPRLACFNTQPPEGGWVFEFVQAHKFPSFNTQPPEGGWEVKQFLLDFCEVSTHSRPKAAGIVQVIVFVILNMFQHTAARRRLALYKS